MRRLELVGQRFGRLIVTEYAYIKNHVTHWKCLCDCGIKKYISSTALRSGLTKSCGCLQRDRTSETHKGKKHPMYNKLGKDNPNYGRLCTDETKKNISVLAKKRYKDPKNHPSYKHGLSKTKAYICEKTNRRNAKKLNQTPILTENEKRKISLYYTISAYLGDGFHVDHEIPLSKGGLHHPDNLQIITATENLKKSNKLDYQVKGYIVKI